MAKKESKVIRTGALTQLLGSGIEWRQLEYQDGSTGVQFRWPDGKWRATVDFWTAQAYDSAGMTSTCEHCEWEDAQDGDGLHCGGCGEELTWLDPERFDASVSQPSDECGVHHTFPPKSPGDEAFEAICTLPAGHESNHHTADGRVW